MIIFSPVVVFRDVFGVFAGFVTIEIGACFVAVSRFTLCMLVSDLVDDKVDDLLLIMLIITIIIITRPKPAYGRQGLAGLWGQDTDKVSNFWVFLSSHFAQLRIKPTWDHS